MSEVPSRQRSQRSNVKSKYNNATLLRNTPKDAGTCVGLNDITDGFEALPLDVIRYFTLLKEIDAKCVSLVPQLIKKIKDFKNSNANLNVQRRNILIQQVIQLLKDLMPCLEEKMHVATIAADRAIHHTNRINDDYELILKSEIPDAIKFGQAYDPAIIDEPKVTENKSLQSQRSESRREALAAKKAAQAATNPDDDKKSKRSDKESTPTTITTKKRKTNPSAGTKPPNNSVITVKNNSNTTSTKVKEDSNTLKPENSSNAKKRTATNKKMKPPTERPISVENSNVNEDGINGFLQQRKSSTNEPLYCYCNQVSYGEMVGCDGEDCKIEWFHLPCTGLTTLPKGKWYCDECSSRLRRNKKI